MPLYLLISTLSMSINIFHSSIHTSFFSCALQNLKDMRFTLLTKHHAIQQPLVHIEVKNVEAEKFEVGLGGWLLL